MFQFCLVRKGVQPVRENSIHLADRLWPVKLIAKNYDPTWIGPCEDPNTVYVLSLVPRLSGITACGFCWFRDFSIVVQEFEEVLIDPFCSWVIPPWQFVNHSPSNGFTVFYLGIWQDFSKLCRIFLVIVSDELRYSIFIFPCWIWKTNSFDQHFFTFDFHDGFDNINLILFSFSIWCSVCSVLPQLLSCSWADGIGRHCRRLFSAMFLAILWIESWMFCASSYHFESGFWKLSHSTELGSTDQTGAPNLLKERFL